MMRAEDSIWFVGLASVLLSGQVLRAAIFCGRALAERRWIPAWRPSIQLMGWLPIAGTALVVGAISFFAPLESSWELPQLDPPRAAATIIPVIAGCHLAFAFSPADENPLETLLVAPRPLAWLLCERAAVTILPYAALASIANLGVLLRFPELPGNFFLHWLPPLLFFAAVSIMTTLTSRQAALGMTLTIVVWTGLAFMGDGMLLRWPHLWPLHVYMQPEQAVSLQAFKLHQAWLILGALAIFVHTAGQLEQTEKLLSVQHT